MSRKKPSLPRGVRDFSPEVCAKRNYIIDKAKQNFIRYGFSQIETPAIENRSVLTGKYGDEGDQLLFSILDSGDFLNKSTKEDYVKGSKHLVSKISGKGLRYDLTIPFARFLVMNQNDIPLPFKRFQIQPVWRAERPQKSRYREFYQCDADIIGSKTIWNEIELSLLLIDIFKDLGLKEYTIKINHREVLFLLAEYVNLKNQTIPFCVAIDKLAKIGLEKVMENILALGADRERLYDIMNIFSLKDRSEILEKLNSIDQDNKGIKEIKSYFEALNQFENTQQKIKLDISLARGLSYYTGMIYEVEATSVQVGSICGGGRYDNLTGIFGLKGISGIGISFGLDRIYDVMEELHLFPEKITQKLDLFIIHFNEKALKYGQKIVMDLRNEGIKTDLFPEPAKIQKQFDYADKIQTPYTLIIGDNEMKSGEYTFKNMQTGEQKLLGLDKIICLFKG